MNPETGGKGQTTAQVSNDAEVLLHGTHSYVWLAEETKDKKEGKKRKTHEQCKLPV